MNPSREDVQSCVLAVLQGRDQDPAIQADPSKVAMAQLIKDEMFRAAIRDELQKAKAQHGWRMNMRDIVLNGCLLNGD